MTITAYKAFNADMTCRGFQYEVGKTYTHDGDVKMCSSGFHACLHPLDVLNYYPAAGSRFALVEMPDAVEDHDGDSKVVGAFITIKAEIQISDMVDAAVKRVFDAAKWIKGKSATGYGGAASATGYGGAASATGYGGAAMASGFNGSVMGADGCALFLTERDINDNILNVWAGISGRDGIKPFSWYRLVNGVPVEIQPEN